MLPGALLVVSLAAAPVLQSTQPPPVSAQELKASIDNLGKLDDTVRATAARTVRRAPPAQAVPALIEAASGNPDGYVRYKALVLLAGFNDPRARDVMLAAIDDPNDRLRTVAYQYFEYNQEPGMAARLLRALDKEESEFVRPALMHALAAYGSDPQVQRALTGLVMHGQDLFRSAMIAALGEYKATYAFDSILQVAKLDGPLQEDAIIALGRIGDKRALATFEQLQRTAPRERQPAVAAAICMLGINCSSHESFVADTMAFSAKNIGFQNLLRASARSLAEIALSGHPDAAGLLADAGIPARDPARSPIALAFGTVALRDTPMMLKLLASRTDVKDAALLLRDAFDELEEDFTEERFFAAVRRAYWQAPEGSPERATAETLIRVLEF